MGMINQFKTVLFLGILTALLLLVGGFFGESGLVIALIIAVLINGVSYFYSDRIALFMYQAKQVKKNEQPMLHRIVRELAQEAGIPEPKGIYIISSMQANAFCAGRGPQHYVVACTQGILDILTEEELKAVLAHEVGHAKNRDVLIATVAATIAGVISYLAQIAQWAAIFGGIGGGNDRNNGENIIGLLVLAILTPIIALIIQLAISRSREYQADETGAKLMKSGKPLARALAKIEKSIKDYPLPFGTKAGASLFIANPFSANVLFNLFSTHPPVKARIERLNAMRF